MTDFYQDRKVLITGGLGFLGSNLAVELVKRGAQVTIADPMLPLYGGNLFNVEDIKDKITVHLSDIRDKDAMAEHVKGQEIIFHIGNQTSHVDSMTDPLLDVDINCRGNIILLEACRKKNPEVKIVYAGTRAQYGKPESVPVVETQAMHPTDIYGANKHAAEQYHMIYYNAFGIRSTTLRINNSYGPRHQMKHGKYGILNWFIRLALDNETIQIYGDGSQMRDYNYVDDVTRAFLFAGSNDASDGEAYNLGSGQPVRFKEMVEKIIEAAGSGRSEFKPWPEDRKQIEVGDYVADYSKIQNTLGWEPKTVFDEGLKRTVDFYKENRSHYWEK